VVILPILARLAYFSLKLRDVIYGRPLS